jgi:hypothetical protein
MSRSSTAPCRPNHKPSKSAVPGRRPQYLAIREGVFYFKRKVPANLVAAFDKEQVWKSLETTNLAEACRRLAKENAAFELQMATLRHRAITEGLCVALPAQTKALGAHMVPALLQRYYVHMLERDEEELRAQGETTEALVKRCLALGFLEGQLCRIRICSGLWGKDSACPSGAQTAAN